MHFMHCCELTSLLLKLPGALHFPIAKFTAPSAGQTKEETMLVAIVRSIREWRRYRRSLSELSHLDDRELADIGLSRSDIMRVAWNVAHQR
jgi:uncharacterized protein YjiS (DUF1127 family)